MSNRDHQTADVPVHADALRATADVLDLLGGFFAETDPLIRARLGCYLIDQHGEEDATDPVTEAVVFLDELGGAADLLHALAGTTSHRGRLRTRSVVVQDGARFRRGDLPVSTGHLVGGAELSSGAAPALGSAKSSTR